MPGIFPTRSFFSVRSPKPTDLSVFAWKLMQAEGRRFTLRNLKLMAVMAAGMVSFFAVLDLSLIHISEPTRPY